MSRAATTQSRYQCTGCGWIGADVLDRPAAPEGERSVCPRCQSSELVRTCL